MAGVRIVAALRTPVAPRGGALSRLQVHELSAPVVQRVLAEAGIAAGDVDEIVVGNALGAGGNPARLVALAAGLPERVAGLTIDRQCCGGLDALVVASAMIKSGQADVVLAGGAESYSRRPLRLRTDPDGGAAVAYDRPPFTPWHECDPEMDNAADALAREYGIAREAQDAWAVESHRKARAAELSAELVLMCGLERDAFTRALSPKVAARAKSLIGSITAANAAVSADGAAFCVLVSDRIAAHLATPGLEMTAGVTQGGRADRPGIAPIHAIRQVFSMSGTAPEDLTVAEIMEAYAVQAMLCVSETGIDPAIVNLGGGALARGHPIGASGAINAVRLFHELKRRPGRGLAAIAAAGGLGTAVMFSST